MTREEAAAYIASLSPEQLRELDRLLLATGCLSEPIESEDDERMETRAILRRAGLL
jgi:hypothetical protein